MKLRSAEGEKRSYNVRLLPVCIAKNITKNDEYVRTKGCLEVKVIARCKLNIDTMKLRSATGEKKVKQCDWRTLL